MSFLFKKQKSGGPTSGLPPAVRKITSRDGMNGAMPGVFGSGAAPLEPERARSGSSTGAPFVSSVGGRSAPSPTPGSRQVVPRGQMPNISTQAPRRHNHQQPPDASLYPWSNQRLSFTDGSSPFPRYGAAVNGIASKDGAIYMMGGLIDGQTVKGDLWVVEAGAQPMACHQVQTSNDGPGPRVGHASILVGNAFIVFGGDTKVDEHDELDNTLYLLNTASRQWSRVAPAGQRPAGRYGHSLNIIGSKIFVFGGQVDGYFFNDLLAFDLNALQTSNSHWETLVQNTMDGGPAAGLSPPARTNHTVVTYDDKLYLYGGTDGAQWFNDVWVYDPRTNSWTQLDCIGYIPEPREGHAAALIADVMYIHGGRTSEGKDLGDIAGFRIPSRRWYTFQNMGPSPSPRSGHGITAYESKLVVLGGEPSSAPRNELELSETYVMDTTKIRYPPDDKPAPAMKLGNGRRPSLSDRTGTPQQERAASRDGSISSQQAPRTLLTKGSQDSMASNNGQYVRSQDPSSTGHVNGALRGTPRSAPSPIQGQSPQQALAQQRANGVRPNVQSSGLEGRESPRMIAKLDRILGSDPQLRENNFASSTGSQRDVNGADAGGSVPIVSGQDDVYNSGQNVSNQQQSTLDTFQRSMQTPESGARSGDDLIQSSFKQAQYADSGVGSSPALSTQQSDNAIKELEALRSKNAWYASELALAKKAGYRSSTDDSPTSTLDDRAADAFGDEEKPLLEALLRMRAELVRMQASLESQSASASERMAQVEKEKEAAVAEALYARTQLMGGNAAATGHEPTAARLEDANRRLASTLQAHNDFQIQIQSLSQALHGEKNAREAAEATANAAQARADDLDSHKQWSAPEIESLRAQLSEAQRHMREDSAKHADALSSSRSLQVDKRELTSKLSATQENQRNHVNVLSTLRDAVKASNDKTVVLERQVEEERQQRAVAEDQLAELRAAHETRASELNSTQRQLRDARDIAETHASEARTHHAALLAGLDNVIESDYSAADANDERVSILQQQVQEAGERAEQLKEQVDLEHDQRRRAEERIAGLEAFQEQQNREALGFRKQIQSASHDHLTLQSSHADLQQQLSKHSLDLAAWQMHHESLRKALGERGFDVSTLPKDISELQLSSDNDKRLQDLEEQIESSGRGQEDMRQMYESREQELRQTRDAEFARLEKDCQVMRNNIEKFHTIAEKLKKDLEKQKEKNRVLREELDREGRSRSAASNETEFEQERSKFRQLVDNLQTRLNKSKAEYESQVQELQGAMSERDYHQEQSTQLQRELESARANGANVDDLRAENEQLRIRSTEAESKVQMLLQSVSTSVTNYRRQSQAVSQTNGQSVGGGHSRGISMESIGGESTYSSQPAGNGMTGDRNSMAQMEAMMHELETIRQGFDDRLSTGSVLDGPGPTAYEAVEEGDDSAQSKLNLADMRRRHLSFDDDDEVDESRQATGASKDDAA